MSDPVHIPILSAVLLEHLALRPGDRCIDATVNGGGHTAAFLEQTAPNGQVLGIDRDPDVLARAADRHAEALGDGRLVLAHGNFRDIGTIAAGHGFAAVRAIVFDVGVSSYHFDLSGRGFRFAADEPLDMRFDPECEHSETAAEILDTRSCDELTTLLRDLGEERFARRIAQAIVRERAVQPIRTTAHLLDVLTRALPGNVRWRAARSAARVFQALRIAVNDELGAIAAALPQAFDLLAPGGRLAVLSFHSLEDRIAKRLFVGWRQERRAEVLTKKPVRADDAEVADNPRAASAKLRVCKRID